MRYCLKCHVAYATAEDCDWCGLPTIPSNKVNSMHEYANWPDKDPGLSPKKQVDPRAGDEQKALGIGGVLGGRASILSSLRRPPSASFVSPPPGPVGDVEINLTMSLRHVAILRRVLRNIGGDAEKTPRKFTQEILHSIDSLTARPEVRRYFEQCQETVKIHNTIDKIATLDAEFLP